MPRDLIENHARAIRAAIVDCDDVEARIILLRDPFDAAGDARFFIFCACDKQPLAEHRLVNFT